MGEEVSLAAEEFKLDLLNEGHSKFLPLLSRFVEFMSTYENDLFDFAYSAERSIEDGIQELSDAEFSTVVISYVVMFVYITIALGKFKGFKNLFVSWRSRCAGGGLLKNSS